MNYAEYTTLDELRKSGEGAQLNISGNAADAFLLSIIREVSGAIDEISNRTYAPYITTQYYDSPVYNIWSMANLYYAGGRAGDVFQSKTGGYSYGRVLRIDHDDLLEITTLTNGDASTITTASYNLYPANVYPKEEIRLTQSSGIAWMPDSNGNYEQVISVLGIFGYHTGYSASAWGGAGTMTDAITTTATTYTASAGANVHAGMLLKADTEFMYADSLSGSTITVERAVNGSTAAAHTTATVVSYWKPIFTVGKIARMATAALWNLRANPIGDTVSINGTTFKTPANVPQWIDHEIDQAGLSRIGLG